MWTPHRVAMLGLISTGLLTATVFIAVSQSSASLSSASPSLASPNQLAAGPGSDYLALGDSVAFGYRESDAIPAPDYFDAASSIGYPEYVGQALDLEVTNASCPGETSSSFVNYDSANNGCEHTSTGAPGYRSTYPLHATYGTSQLTFAEQFLRAHPDTRLVSLMIGINDVLICDGITSSDGCSSELSGVLSTVGSNITRILDGIRKTAGYNGQIVIANYYSPESTSPTVSTRIDDLNDAIDDAAEPFDVELAHVYSAFNAAAQQTGYNFCTAGLLTELTGSVAGTCGLHPSVTGQTVIAQSVEDAVKK